MRAAGRVAAGALRAAGALAAPGVATDDIDAAVHDYVIARGAYPSPLRYGGFPKSCCTSVNECACHGVPDGRQLVEGDVINVDVTAFVNGYHADTNATFYVVRASPLFYSWSAFHSSARCCRFAALPCPTSTRLTHRHPPRTHHKKKNTTIKNAPFPRASRARTRASSSRRRAKRWPPQSRRAARARSSR